MARKKHAEEHENHERWLVSYADFITLLFAFFVVMYSVSRVDLKRMEQTSNAIKFAMHFEGTGGTGAPPVFEGPASQGGCVVNLGGSNNSLAEAQKLIRRNVEVMRKKIEGKLAPFLVIQKASSYVSVIGEDGKVTIRLAASHFFDPSQAAVRPETLPILDAIGDELREVDRPIRIEGHTDDSTISSDRYRSNWDLSTARASTVTAFFEAAHGIPASHLTAVGYASSRPMASNDTPEGRDLNRRIEIVVEVTGNDPLAAAVR